MQLSTATSSASVELHVLSSCHVDVLSIVPFLRDGMPPVWLLILLCFAKAPSIHQLIVSLLSVSRVSQSAQLPTDMHFLC